MKHTPLLAALLLLSAGCVGADDTMPPLAPNGPCAPVPVRADATMDSEAVRVTYWDADTGETWETIELVEKDDGDR